MKWISHLISDSRHTGLFFSSLVPPNFSTKKKIRQAANRPFLVTGFTGIAALIGWLAVYFLVLKLGSTSEKTTLYISNTTQTHIQFR